MAAISLYATQINQMPGLIRDIKSAVSDFKTELTNFHTKALSVSNDICNLNEVIESIKASTSTQDDKNEALDSFIQKLDEFTDEVVEIDKDVAEAINESKNDFYEEYEYLRPDCEKKEKKKSTWDKVCGFFKTAVEWCKEHWKVLATVVLVIAAVVIIVATGGTALGPLSALLLMVAKGILVGTVVGGVAGGITSAITGGSFWEGVEEGAFSGAVSGAISGGLGGWLSSFGRTTIPLAKTILIGGTAEAGSSVLGNLGDIFISKENISFLEIFFDATFSFGLGCLASGASFKFSNKLGLKVKGINVGHSSWEHIWKSQLSRSLNHGYKISYKTIFRGYGAQVVNDVWDYAMEFVKGFTNELKDGNDKAYS